MREMSDRAVTESGGEETGRLEASATKLGPQTLTWRFRLVGHQGREAEAFSAAQREKTAAAASERRESAEESSLDGRRAK